MAISLNTRRDIFDDIMFYSISWSGGMREPDFLNRIFDLNAMQSYDYRFSNAYDDIFKHRVMNYDWDDNWIVTDHRLNLLHCDESKFMEFLLLTIDPFVKSDDERINQLLEIYNRHLANEGIEIYEKNKIGGKPRFAYRLIPPSKPNVITTDEKRIALVIGCAEYEYAGKLKNPINDAMEMEDALEKLGFDVIYISNPSLRQLKEIIDEFGIELEKYDVGLFYFAGHGVQVKGLNYLIPADANLKAEVTVEYDCVRVDRVLSHMEASKIDVNIIILDACRNNPFERSWGRSASGRGLAPMDAPTGSFVAYATSPGKIASDGLGDNGLYTGELISKIDIINQTITQLFQNVRKDVMDKSDNEQVPWESTSLTADFYFNKK